MIHLRQVKTQCYVCLWIFVVVLNMNFPLWIIHNDSIIDRRISISWRLIRRHNLLYSIQFNSRDISNEIDN